MTGPYDDMLRLPRHVSPTRAPMSAADRAAQFAPFAALTGHAAAIKEAARLTDARPELDECAKEALNEKLKRLADRLGDRPAVSITYFQPDAKKAGGAFVTASGPVKKLDGHERIVVMADGVKIPFEDLFEIEGDLFSALP